MKLALLGPEGTFTHEAASEQFEKLEPVFCSNIEEVFNSEFTGFVPVENSLGGGVRDTIDLFREKDIRIAGEHILEIQHCLVSKENSLEAIETVYSHPQALAQCSEFLKEYGFEKVESSSTAAAAEDLGDGEAAIASKKAAELNGLNVLKEGIQDSKSYTRFLILDGDGSEPKKTSLILEPREDRPGLLHSMLGCFAGHGINLSHIESRPTGELGTYFFYVEADADSKSEAFERANTCLKTYTEVKVLGSYS